VARGRRIAFDYGDARIGVSICDPDGILATPLDFLDARDSRLHQRISELLAEYQPITIFLGNPKHLSGVDGEAVAKVAKFSDLIATLTQAPIVLVDERLSTREAQRKLHEAGKSAKSSRSLIDSMSAVAILEAGLANEAR